MSRPNNTLKLNQDDRLIDFTDRLIAGQAQQTASNTEGELLLLQETVLRLSIAYPPVMLDEARVKQMYVRLKNRITREAQKKEQSMWTQWLGVLQDHPQAAMMAGALSLLLIFAILSPLFSTAGLSITATALNPAQRLWTAVGLVGVILFIVWIIRRK